jgi:hypothetical protein
MVASVESAGEALEVGKAREVFEGDFRGGMFGINIAGYLFVDYDVTPDGQRFVMFPGSDASAANTDVTMIFNWFEDLNRTLPPAR